MTCDNASLPDWIEPISRALHEQGQSGVFFVAFETYRPDLVRAMAHALGFRFIDFRAEHMQPLGAGASGLPISRIEEVVDEAQRDDPAPDGIVLHNAEALLATCVPEQRAAWMSRMIAASTRVPVLFPLAVFTDAAPAASARVVRLGAIDMPAEKLLFRLAAQ